MKLLDVLNSPWAIMPERYVQVRDIYLRHLGGEKISEDTIKAIEASMGRPLENPEQGYEIVNGAAIIPVDGVIAARMNLFSRISGGCSIELLTRDFRQAQADGAVNKIIFAHGSPGGVVEGIQDFSAEIFSARGGKPIYAWTGSQMCSASYWLAAACDALYISNDTTQVGSIGVITSHTDISKQEQMLGVKTTPIYAGTYKAFGNKYEPLTKESRASIQEIVDYLYSVFVADVAKFRGVSEQKALAMSDGKVFIGKQAMSAGLVDGVSTLDALISQDVNDAQFKVRSSIVSISVRETDADEDNSARAAGKTETIKEETMTKDEIKAKYPEAYKAIFAEGAAQAAQDMMPVEDCEKKKEDVKKEGATAECGRIQGVFAQSMPGHEALIQALAFDGKTTGPEAAVAVLKAEKDKKGKVLEGLKGNASAAVAAAAAPAFEQADKNKQAADDALPVEERAKAAWDKDPKLRAEFGSYDAYFAYEKANDEGRVRMLSKK